MGNIEDMFNNVINVMNPTSKKLDSQHELIIKQKSELTKIFIDENMKFFPNANKNVLQFIADFLYHGVPDLSLEDSAESIRSTFRAGYCYYFAIILKEAFGRGHICWAAPFSHIVWVDINGVPYDIEGVNCSECDYYIPIEYLGDSISSFKHIPGIKESVEEANVIIRRFEADLQLGKLSNEVLDCNVVIK